MESEWTCVAVFSYAGEHFTIWAQPIKNSGGTFNMATKSKKETFKEMRKHLKEQGIKYIAS